MAQEIDENLLRNIIRDVIAETQTGTRQSHLKMMHQQRHQLRRQRLHQLMVTAQNRKNQLTGSNTLGLPNPAIHVMKS